MTATMLPAVWTLRDVIDVEALCRGVIRELTGARSPDRTTRPGDWLEPIDYETSLAFLLGEAHVQEQVFLRRALDKKPGIVFRPWLYQQLRSRLIDEWRSPRMFGRHGQHRVPNAGQGAQSARDQGREEQSDEDNSGRLGQDLRADRLHGVASGDPADRTPTDRWLYPEADRNPAEQVGGLGGDKGAGAAVGADRAGVVSGGRAGRGAQVAFAAASFVDCGCGWRSYRQAPNGVGRWHWPECCVGCGGALLEPVESEPIPGSGGLEERREVLAA